MIGDLVGNVLLAVVGTKGVSAGIDAIKGSLASGKLADMLGAIGRGTATTDDLVDSLEGVGNAVDKGIDDISDDVTGSVSSEIRVQHAVSNAKQAQSVLDGINPKYFNSGSRFGGGFYIGGDSNTIVAELAEHGNVAKYAISYDMDLSGQKVLDLTNPDVAAKWNYVQNGTSTKECQSIGEIAQSQGYSVIKCQSYRGSGINYVIYNDFENILSAKMVTPVE
jgi:hypothetical protein